MSPFGKSRAPAIPPRDPDRPQDDPWDADAVRYLRSKPEGLAWKRGVLMECMREQKKWVASDSERVQEAARLAMRYGVERRPDTGGTTIHFFRTDRRARWSYPKSAAERRAWLMAERSSQ